MKKLFTLIAITSAIIPALHGMETTLSADVQKKYYNLTALIQNADVDAFKAAFDELTLPTEKVAALGQIVAETKTTITNELKAMDDKTKNWSKIAIGGLVGAYGLSNVMSSLFRSYYLMTHETLSKTRFKKLALPADTTLKPLFYAYSRALKYSNIDYYSTMQKSRKALFPYNILASLLTGFIAYKTIPYGIKTFNAGLNYTEHLQNMLTNLDAIDAHITQAKVQN